jgi:hypothetical protein
MKKLMIFIFLMVAISLFTQNVDIQVLIPANNTITYNLFYPAYFNPEEPEQQPLLFKIQINSSVGNAYYLRCIMEYKDCSPAGATLTPLEGFQHPITITNSEIIVEEGSSSLFFSVSNCTFDDFLDDIEDQIKETGRMPDGTYKFTIQAYETGSSSPCDEDFIYVNIISPFSISLIIPGNPIGLGPAKISDNYPNFVWFSNLTDYTIKIYELEDEFSTAEEIEQLEPFFEEQNPSTSFLYPTYAPDFLYNKIYAWQVFAEIQNPIATEQYKSIIYLFMLSSEEEGINNQMLINFLSQLNIEGVNDIIALIEGGFSVDKLIWGAREITMEELNDILKKISEGELKVKNLTVE